ncbi:MAG: hypothetical protein V4760_17670 [Bdellovibrionota bacterium]
MSRSSKKTNMKSLLTRVILATAIAFAAVISANEANAQSPMSVGSSENVPGIQLKNITPFVGQHVTIFYVLATKPLISVNERQISVSEIRYLMTKPVSSAIVAVPPMKLQIVGFRPGFNYIAVVFHAQPNFVWMNADGGVPADPRGLTPQSASTTATHIMTFSKAQIEAIAARQGKPETITIEL